MTALPLTLTEDFNKSLIISKYLGIYNLTDKSLYLH